MQKYLLPNPENQSIFIIIVHGMAVYDWDMEGRLCISC
jgi:hypothetical protein